MVSPFELGFQPVPDDRSAGGAPSLMLVATPLAEPVTERDRALHLVHGSGGPA